MTDPRRATYVVGLGDLEHGRPVLAHALDLAHERPPVALHVVRAIEPAVDIMVGYTLPQLRASSLAALQECVMEEVEAAIARHGELRVAEVVVHISIETPARAIVELAAQLDADLVMVGTHGRRGLPRMFMGSVAEQVVRRSGCQVLVVRPKTHDEAMKEPHVEPLCDECAKARADTNGSALWCARHAEHHPRAHVYRYEPRSTESVRAWGFHP